MNVTAEETETVCEDLEQGALVFAPREMLSEEERERADLHLSRCFACQLDIDTEYLLKRISEED